MAGRDIGTFDAGKGAHQRQTIPGHWAVAGLCRQDLGIGEVWREGCYRPVTRDGLPLMGAVPGIEGAYVATGHSVWGMLNPPVSGETIAGLIFAGRSEAVDRSAFDLGRFSGLRS